MFSIYRTTTYGFNYAQTSPGSSEEEYLQFVAACKAQSLYHRDVGITADDCIVTLSTCDYALDAKKGRLVLQAKMVKQGERPEEHAEEPMEEEESAEE